MYICIYVYKLDKRDSDNDFEDENEKRCVFICFCLYVDAYVCFCINECIYIYTLDKRDSDNDFKDENDNKYL
jgi:hypothetical protein